MFAHTNLITYESLYSSSYLLNENLLYDKLWGPSQRVVTLFGFLEGETTWTLQSSDISVALQDRIISDVRKVWKIVLCLNNLLWENSDYMKHMNYVD